MATMSNTKDMTKGSPWKLIVTFAIPIFLSNLFQTLYNTFDSFIVGRFINDDALAAVSSSGNLIFLFTSFFIGMFAGAGTVIANYFGKKDYENMQRAIHTDVVIALVASVALTVLGVIFTPLILKAMGTAPEVLPNSIEYFRWYFAGITGLVVYNCLNSILHAVGNSRRGLYYLIISSLVNVGLDLLFIAGFKWGVWAAAFATSISQVISALLCLGFLTKPGSLYAISFKKIRFHGDMVKSILRFGVPSGIQNSVIGLANVLVQSNINSFGNAAMAGCGSYSKLEGFAFLPINCFSLSISTFISQNLGAKEYGRAKKGAIFGIITSVLMSEIIGVIMYFGCPLFISWFARNPESVAFGVQQAKTMSLFYFALSFSHCVSAVCRGGGKPTIPMLVMLIDWCGIRILYITLMMAWRHEIALLFWAYPLTWGISSVFYLFYLIFSDWVHGFDKIEEKRLRQLEKENSLGE